MSKLEVTLLFCKDRTTQPPAILQCDTSGEYFPYFFVDWRDGVHYIYWCKVNSLNPKQNSIFNKWSKINGYEEEGEFIGNLNEFIDRPDEITVFTSIGVVNSSENLQCKSAWDDSMKIEEFESDSE